MWYVYLLRSEVDGRTYIGSTSNLERRLKEHNEGLVFSTKSRRPLKLIYREDFSDEVEARRKEHYYKTAAGRRKLKNILSLL